MIKNINIPWHLKKGIGKNHKGGRRINLMAGDVETLQGKPITLQLTNNKKQTTVLTEIDENNILDEFMFWVYDHAERYSKKAEIKENLLFFHNLEFDLSAILIKYHDCFGENQFVLRGKLGSIYWTLEVFATKTIFARLFFHKAGFITTKRPKKITDKRKKKVKNYNKIISKVTIIDTFAYYKTSLKKLSQDLKLEHKKLDHPIGLGEKDLRDDPYFLEYAENDSLVGWEVGEVIAEYHNKYDLSPCVSLPQMAMRIFKHKFFNEDDLLTYPEAFDQEATLSYHGGKNGFYVDKILGGKPPWKIDYVAELDVVSLYPYCMTKVPNYNHCEYEKTYELDEREGIFCITGDIIDTLYKILPSHDFKYPHGKIKDMWVTSYELRHAIENHKVKIKDMYGLVVEEQKGETNPIKEYVDYFFAKKQQTSKEDANYPFYKIMQNSLYGKFIQNIDYSKNQVFKIIDEKTVERVEHEFKAGGLFNPMIATMITGLGRTMLTKMEEKYEALDSSTDSIKTTMEPEKKDMGKELGKLDYKFKDYDIYFFRNKFYIAIGETIEYAVHGCQAGKDRKSQYGRVEAVLKMMINQDYKYKYKRMVKVRESLKRKDLTPLSMNEFEAELCLR